MISYDFSQYGGVNSVLANKAIELGEKYSVNVLSLTSNKKAYELNDSIRFDSILDNPTSISRDTVFLFRRVISYLNENKIDVAILMGHYPAFIVGITRFFCRTRLVFADHGALMNQWDDKKVRLMRRAASLLCHKVITLTEQSREDYIRKFYLPRKKVECIYNWIDLSVAHSENYDADSKRIISAGRFGKEKGFDMLIKAFAPVAKKHPDWHLDLFGDGEMMDTVKNLIEEYGISDNVHLMGMCGDLAVRYKDYAMYVLPSYREGMPLVLLEAKANRLPIVSFDILTGPREIVRDGVDGILVEPQNTEQMAKSICELVENKEKRIAFSNASWDNIDKFSKDTILAKWKKLIETL